MDISKIEERIDKTVSAATPINVDLGGIQLESMIQMMELAKAMAISGPAVPVWLRGNTGGCLAIWIKATRFGFDPYALAEHSFITVKRQKNEAGQWEDVETVAFDSAVIRAIIAAHAPIDGRLNYSFEGEGDARVCIVTGTPRGASMPLVHRSLPLGERKKSMKRNDDGKIKGSPLWDSKPDVQLAYDTGRDWCRMFYPEVLMGWHDKDDFEEASQSARAEKAKDITPKIADRLKGNKGRGFDAKHVEKETAASAPVTAEGAKAGEVLASPEKSAPESPGDASPAGSQMMVPDAFAAGQEAKRQGKPLEYPSELAGDEFAAHRDAFKEGYEGEAVAA